MPFDFNVFMSKVNLDNTHFKRFARTSHLDPIIKELKDKKFIAPAMKDKLQSLVSALPDDQLKKYTQALGYLNQQGGIRPSVIPVKPVMQFVKFSIAIGLYFGYNGNDRQQIDLDPSKPNSPGPRSFFHTHRLSWSSSNGNPASLSTVWTREHVKFLADTQAPPFNNIQDPDREFYMPQGGAIGGSSNEDDHSTKLPALICRNPRVPGTLIGQQKYQYSIDSGATWVNMPGGEFLLEKTVRKEGNDWVFIFKKSNWAPLNPKPFHFEVHYTIGNAPLYLPRSEADVPPGINRTADINQFARKVIM